MVAQLHSGDAVFLVAGGVGVTWSSWRRRCSLAESKYVRSNFELGMIISRGSSPYDASHLVASISTTDFYLESWTDCSRKEGMWDTYPRVGSGKGSRFGRAAEIENAGRITKLILYPTVPPPTPSIGKTEIVAGFRNDPARKEFTRRKPNPSVWTARNAATREGNSK